MHPLLRVLGWSYVAICAAIVARALATPEAELPVATFTPPRHVPVASPATDAAEWFRRVKPYCNAVEITVVQRQSPAPATPAGVGFHAACYALAGKIDDARRLIDALPQGDRYRAAGIVFDVGHPVADAGDDRSAGPIMELVIDYWPNHYMALYHAGMAEYMLGQRDLARKNLEAFLQYYHENDGWRTNGAAVLRRLQDSAAAQADVRRPHEPVP
jgi:tetratricopeptide (TPR) repeat protein